MVHASLFSGIGGPEVAAAMLGWENAFHCEINPFGRAVLDYWFPESKSYEDVTKTSFKEWRGRIDVLTGGFPCQPFSYAGKRAGREDERYLWPEMLRAIDEVRPTWVVGENVAGITTMVEGGILADLGGESSLFAEGDDLHRYELDQSFTIERICGDLERLGYSVQPLLVPAAAVGAPHRRERIFILAHRDSDRAEQLVREESEVAEREQDPEPSGAGERVREDASDSQRGRGGALPAPVHAGEPDGYLPFGDGRLRTPSDSDREGREEPVQSGRGEDREEEGAGVDDRAERHGRDGVLADPGLLPENRWAGFPSVSPIHRRNDGLPYRMDRASIPFNRWRTEALKAYGNAIVPQVMYRIFQAIESASHEQQRQP